jgi:glycerophosphoryl diester phosphodiesterase
MCILELSVHGNLSLYLFEQASQMAASTYNLRGCSRLERQCLNALLFFFITAAGAIPGCAGGPTCEKITNPHVGFQNECSIDQWRMLRQEYAGKNPSDTGRLDPIFKMEKLYQPILFAHRGGALEAPESTLKAFNFAWYEAGADVLEVDIQLTKDGEFVVWHGPKLDNVHVSKVNHDPKKRPTGRKRIYDFAWCELDGQAWVSDPWDCDLECLSQAPDKDQRELLLFSEFLQAYAKAPLNIELKKSFLKKLGGRDGLDDNIKEFFKILEEYGGNRTIIVTSANGQILKAFRNINKGKYHTTPTAAEQFAIKFFNKTYHKPIVETTYANFWTNRILIDTVHAQGGVIYVFITGFGPIPALDSGRNYDGPAQTGSSNNVPLAQEKIE